MCNGHEHDHGQQQTILGPEGPEQFVMQPDPDHPFVSALELYAQQLEQHDGDLEAPSVEKALQDVIGHILPPEVKGVIRNLEHMENHINALYEAVTSLVEDGDAATAQEISKIMLAKVHEMQEPIVALLAAKANGSGGEAPGLDVPIS